MKIVSAKQIRRAFSLLEVMIAIGLLFMGTFAILALNSSSLNNVRRLQRPLVDASALVSQLSLTNQLVEGDFSGLKSWTTTRTLGMPRKVWSSAGFVPP